MNINKYKDWRKEIEACFNECEIVTNDTEEHVSPSGKYKLVIEYFEKADSWNYSKGTIINLSTNKVITEVKRNYGVFWHTWVKHANNNEYLLCGEDYQGYTTINLTKEKTHIYFPEDGYEGSGFCWAAVYPSPDSSLLAVDGCYWACPYDLVLFDFKYPDVLPYKELKRFDSLDKCSGWSKENTLILTREVEVRKSDQKPYSELSDKEQSKLDEDSSLIGLIKENITINSTDVSTFEYKVDQN